MARLPPRIEVETDAGPFLLPAEDEVMTPWIQEHGWWARTDLAAMCALASPGDTVLDIGAHAGYMAVMAARVVGAGGRVIAVEPAPDNLALLRANLERTGVENVEVVAAAAWRAPGEVVFSISPVNSGDHRCYARPDTETIGVSAVAMDDVLAPSARLDVVKIDAQGCDHVAIEGMEEAIERERPTMLVEFWPPGIRAFGEDPESVLNYYSELSYRVAVLGAPKLEPTGASTILEVAEASPGEHCTLLLHHAA